MHKVPTVSELITKLEKMPPDAPVYIRAKYSVLVDRNVDYGLDLNAVCLMNPAKAYPYPDAKFKACVKGAKQKMQFNKDGDCVTLLF